MRAGALLRAGWGCYLAPPMSHRCGDAGTSEFTYGRAMARKLRDMAAIESIRRRGKLARVRLFERLGSDRYSWPALADLDRKLVERLPDGPGTFLEIGANDGYSQSNTWNLERQRGWSGVLIEPLPRLYRSCKRARPRSTVFNYACVGPGGPTTIDMVDRNLMSVARGLQDEDGEAARVTGHERMTITVPTATLSDLLDRAGVHELDLASVDVEGAELSVLSGLDLDRHCPRWLLVETEHPDRVADLVAPHLVMIDKLSKHDFLFGRP